MAHRRRLTTPLGFTSTADDVIVSGGDVESVESSFETLEVGWTTISSSRGMVSAGVAAGTDALMEMIPAGTTLTCTNPDCPSITPDQAVS